VFGLEPLHGAAVGTDHGAILLLGPSGAGKSSLAAVLLARGATLLADDACALDDDCLLWPGPPLLRLRDADAVASVPGATVGTYDGKAVIRPDAWAGTAVTPAAVVVLDPGPDRDLALRRLTAREALTTILAHVRGPTVLPRRRRAGQLARAARLAGSRPVATLSYTPGRHPVAPTAEAVVEWLAENPGPERTSVPS